MKHEKDKKHKENKRKTKDFAADHNSGLVNNHQTNTSKQKKTNEEKQAKKKELDRAIQGGALETSWTAPE